MYYEKHFHGLLNSNLKDFIANLFYKCWKQLHYKTIFKNVGNTAEQLLYKTPVSGCLLHTINFYGILRRDIYLTKIKSLLKL